MRKIRLWVLGGIVCGLSCAIGCRSKGPSQLCGGFSSYETAQEVRDTLRQAGVIGHWQEKSQAVGPPDRRPPYQMLTLSGPFSLSQIEGSLELTLYNDRLMSAQFSTRNGRELLSKLREGLSQIPESSGKEIEIDRRTRFVYYIDPDGTFRFRWADSQLENEWQNWLRSHS